MSTDMVLTQPPEIIISLDDLLKKGKIRMSFVDFADIHKEFEYAPKGSAFTFPF